MADIDRSLILWKQEKCMNCFRLAGCGSNQIQVPIPGERIHKVLFSHFENSLSVALAASPVFAFDRAYSLRRNRAERSCWVSSIHTRLSLQNVAPVRTSNDELHGDDNLSVLCLLQRAMGLDADSELHRNVAHAMVRTYRKHETMGEKLDTFQNF